jgi:hypothetical protein
VDAQGDGTAQSRVTITDHETLLRVTVEVELSSVGWSIKGSIPFGELSHRNGQGEQGKNSRSESFEGPHLDECEFCRRITLTHLMDLSLALFIYERAVCNSPAKELAN